MVYVLREKEILRILRKKKTVRTKELCDLLFCSEASVRRSLQRLEKNGLIKRFHGGATLIPDTNIEYPFYYRESKNQEEKAYISDLALDFIANGHALFLDSSSTVAALCPKLDRYNDLSVITNGLQTALTLTKISGIQTFMAGGQVKESSTSVIGELPSQFVRNFHVDLAILSCRGLDQEGIYEADHHQALVKQHMIENADLTILLCDHSKVGHKHLYKLVDFDRVDAFITDKKPSENILQAIEGKNCEVIY